MDTSTASSQGTQLFLSCFFVFVCVRACVCVCACVTVRMYSNDVNLPHRRHDRQRLAFNLWGTSEREPVMVFIYQDCPKSTSLLMLIFSPYPAARLNK